MNFALIAHSAVLAPLHYWMRWLIAAPKSPRLRAPHAASTYSGTFNNTTASHEEVPLPMDAHASCRSAPLRIVSIFEAGQERCSTGRIRISGRMADVCAELDRLAAHEAMI